MKEIGNRYHEKKGRWCPECEKEYNSYPALSRKDNETEICPECGQREALEAFQGYLKVKHEGDK